MLQTREFQVALTLAKRDQYLDAADRFKELIKREPKWLPDILIPLYKWNAAQYENVRIRILISELYIAVDRYEEAIEELDDAYELAPTCTDIYYQFGKIYKKNGVHPRISEIFESAFSQGIEDAAIFDFLPQMFVTTGRHDHAVRFYQTLSERFPDRLHYIKTIAELYEQQQRYEAAADLYVQLSKKSFYNLKDCIEKCEALLKGQPTSIAIRRILIEMYFKQTLPNAAVAHLRELATLEQGAYRMEAVQLCRDALKLFPDFFEALMALSDFLMAEKQYTESVSFLRRAFEINPQAQTAISDMLAQLLKQQPDQILARNLVADICYSLKQHDLMLNEIKEILGLLIQPEPWIYERLNEVIKTVPMLVTHAHYLLALYYFRLQEWKRCMGVCEYLNGTDYEPQADYLKVQIYEALNRFEDGKRILIRLFEKDRHNSQVFSKLSEIHERQLKGLLHEKPESDLYESPKSLFQKGLIHLRLGDLVAALEHFQRVQSDSHLQHKALMLMSRCFLEMGRFDLALSQLKRALAQTEDMKFKNEIRFMKSVNYVHLGYMSDCIRCLEEIMECQIHYPNIGVLLNWVKAQSALEFRGKAMLASYDRPKGALTVFSVPNMEGKLYSKRPQDIQRLSFAHPHNNQGVDYVIKKQFKAAEDAFHLSIQMDPQFTVAYCNLALLMLIRRDFVETERYLKQAETVCAKIDLIPAIYGLMYMEQGQWPQAISACSDALATNPENYVVRLNLGDAHFYHNDLKSAFQHWEAAMRTAALSFFVHRRMTAFLPVMLGYNHWVSDFHFKFADYFKAGNHL